MGKYKKILAAYDGSPSSQNALRQAIKLAQTEGCWLKALAVVPSYEGELELVGVRNIRELLRGPGQELTAQAKEIARAEGFDLLTNIEEGEPYERIVEVASSYGCDLIVMGRRGRSRLERALMGSVTARVIGSSKVDVLVVPRDASIGWGRILLATDGSEFSRAALQHALNFARSYGGRLLVVSVAVMNEELLAQAPDVAEKLTERARAFAQEAQAQAEAQGVSAQVFVREGDAHQKIVEVALKEGADVIFMGSHGRTGLRKLLMGSVTEKVIGLSACPVLVVRA